MGEHGTREARDRRLPAPGGARRPLPRRQAGAPRLDRELLDQGDREALRVRAHRRGRRAATSRSSASRSGSRRATTRCSRRSSATTRRTAARPSSCTSGSCAIRPPSIPWRLPPDRAPEAGGGRGARRGARGAQGRSCSRVRRRASPRRLLAHLLDYHRREAEAASGGSGSAASSSTTTSSSRTATRSAGSSGTGRRPRSTGRATSTALVPAAGAQDRARGVRTRRPEGDSGHGVDDEQGSSRCSAASKACGRAAPARAHPGPADPDTGVSREALLALRPRLRATATSRGTRR